MIQNTHQTHPPVHDRTKTHKNTRPFLSSPMHLSAASLSSTFDFYFYLPSSRGSHETFVFKKDILSPLVFVFVLVFLCLFSLSDNLNYPVFQIRNRGKGIWKTSKKRHEKKTFDIRPSRHKNVKKNISFLQQSGFRCLEGRSKQRPGQAYLSFIGSNMIRSVVFI
jgi:hypothetical protein